MLAMEVSASIFCARESWRGSESMASTVRPRSASACISSGFWAGHTKPISVAPGLSCATSPAVGGRTRKTRSAAAWSAAASGAMLAPAAW